MPEFPEGFPDNFEKTLRDAGAKEQEFNVYRVAKSGILNRDAFLSTFEEEKKGLVLKQRRSSNSLSLYSTSCSLDLERIMGLLQFFMQSNPKAIILKGVTSSECGLSQLTAARIEGYRDPYHVDWWLYRDADPCRYFEKV